jgi:general L-amino acid transport system permease protein
MSQILKPPRQVFWTRGRIKATLFQAGFIVCLVLLVWFIFSNTLANISNQGIASGFGFLEKRAGFDVALSFIPFTSDSTYARAFWVAVVNTLVLSGLGIVLATILGFSLGLARVSKNWLIARLATVYIETFRNIPLLLQMFFWYFAILRPLPSPRDSVEFGAGFFLNNRGLSMPRPLFETGSSWVFAVLFVGFVFAFYMARRALRIRKETGHGVKVIHWWLLGLVIAPAATWFLVDASMGLSVPVLTGFNFRGGMVVLPEMLAALLALSFYISAAVGEIVRAGIQGVDHGQTEAAEALGHSRKDLMRLIVIPQAMLIIIPPLTTQYLSLAKNTSLAAAIAFPEVISIVAGSTLTQTGQAVETIALAMVFYIAVSLAIAGVMNYLNYRVMRQRV